MKKIQYYSKLFTSLLRRRRKPRFGKAADGEAFDVDAEAAGAEAAAAAGANFTGIGTRV